MSNFTLFSLVLSLICSATLARSNDAIYIDTQSDFDGQPKFALNCDGGYSDSLQDLNCSARGAVQIPEEDLHGQVGFWTVCEDYCIIIYEIQPGDSSFAVRLYQRNAVTEFHFNDGVFPRNITGEGWVDFHTPIPTRPTKVFLEMFHQSEDSFSILDRIALNAELPPLVPPVYCPAYPNATEHTALVPHRDSVVSTSCGEVFTQAGGISYKPFEAVQANERCVWTIAVPDAKGYDVTILYYGYQPEENNGGGHGLIISEFGAWRAPTHFIPTSTDKVELVNASMLLITFFTGSEPTSDQAGFILRFSARMEGDLSHPVSPLSRHYLVGDQQYYLPHERFHPNEMSSFVFLPKDNIYRPEKENRVFYVHGQGQDCAYDQLKFYLFNTTCLGPHKWQYQGRMCGNTPAYEMLKSSEPMLIVFETTRGSDDTATYLAPQFTYSA